MLNFPLLSSKYLSKLYETNNPERRKNPEKEFFLQTGCLLKICNLKKIYHRRPPCHLQWFANSIFYRPRISMRNEQLKVFKLNMEKIKVRFITSRNPSRFWLYCIIPFTHEWQKMIQNIKINLIPLTQNNSSDALSSFTECCWAHFDLIENSLRPFLTREKQRMILIQTLSSVVTLTVFRSLSCWQMNIFHISIHVPLTATADNAEKIDLPIQKRANYLFITFL